MKKRFIIKTLNSVYTLTQDERGYRVTKIEGRTSKSAYMVQKILVEPYVHAVPRVDEVMRSATLGAWRTSLVQEVTPVNQARTFTIRVVVEDAGKAAPEISREDMIEHIKVGFNHTEDFTIKSLEVTAMEGSI